ncbi:MAG TPA: SusD/RagB family nutrient-binding outer membrane lipoprotein [Flavisolibacter sp.]|jgi:hypothetical protein|nr:SusD/RagB family nutrient-binding outer membrane lipoprotein [Flavisolibacter sp.]
MKKYFFIFILPAVVFAVGCNKLKDFGSTNINPNASTTPIVGALMTNVQAGIGGYAAQTRPGLYAQYFSETQYTDVSLYSLPQLNFSGEYAGSLYDLQNIINQNVSNNQNVVARILMQYIFWTLTDRWGDIPYSEALTGNATPKYDKQEDIYKGMINTLKAAVDQFDPSSPITGDIIYNGNIANWKKLANTLRMAMALRLSKVYPSPSGYAATEFKAALQHPAGVITSNAENFTVNYPGGNFQNPWFATYNGRRDFGESATMTTLMTNLNDPRQQAFGTSTVGVPYGVTRAKAEAFTGANTNWSRILREDLRQDNSSVVVYSAAQATLARAEAADYGWTSENLTNLYQTGITLSFQQWGLPAPSASYFLQPNVALTAPAGTGANLQKIATQRYIASYPNGLEGWSIWRKTGYPVLTPAPDAVTTTGIPRRYTYGQNEYATNDAATKAAASAIGGDEANTRVWWDKQ